MKTPASDAEFFWNAEPGELPTEFMVTNRKFRMAYRHQGEGDPAEKFRSYLSAKALGLEDKPHEAPAAVFASVFLSHLSKAQVESILSGLAELQIVEGQDWARVMADTLVDLSYRWQE